jgi:diguanylate cyclase (GGDEF)-like protein/PAS domain S-box-containing protein
MLAHSDENSPNKDDDGARLRALDEYAVFDTPPDADLDRLVVLAARMYGAPVAAVSLVGSDRLFFKSRFGMHATGISRDGTFCTYAIESDGVFVVLDASMDERFACHPLVAEDPKIRFYAGVPLTSPSGRKIGTLCVLDVKPREGFSEADCKNLQDVAALVMNRLELHRLNNAKQEGHLRYERIAATSPDAIVGADSEGAINYWNSAAEKLFGFAAAEAVGQPIGIIFPERMRKLQTAEVMCIAKSSASHSATGKLSVVAQRNDGRQFPAELSLSTWRDGGEVSFGAILRDTTDRQTREQHLLSLAQLDPLTALPGRRDLLNRIKEAVAAGTGTLMLVDLDGFRYVNNLFGHTAGDLVLTEAADRLRSQVSPTTVVARVGADDFAILLVGPADRVTASRVAEDLVQLFAAPFAVEGEVIHVGINIGIAAFPAHGREAEEIYANADLALQRAKAMPGTEHQFYKPNLHQAVVARRRLEMELRRALSEEQFELHYQPQVRLSDRRVMGAEALLRWRHPERGLLAPGVFLPALEASPLAIEIGHWVLDTACAEAALWRRTVCADFRIAVNLFGVQFNGGDLPTRVEQALLRNALPATALELEITENIMLRREENVIVPLREMRAWGVDIAFDDYGTGYASLSLLKRYPVSRLKIDRSFVRDLCTDTENAAIVHAIMYLGRRFGLNIIAEGIETDQQEELLRMFGCTCGQGFLYGRPMPAKELTAILQQNGSPRRTVA